MRFKPYPMSRTNECVILCKLSSLDKDSVSFFTVKRRAHSDVKVKVEIFCESFFHKKYYLTLTSRTMRINIMAGGALALFQCTPLTLSFKPTPVIKYWCFIRIKRSCLCEAWAEEMEVDIPLSLHSCNTPVVIALLNPIDNAHCCNNQSNRR